MSAADLIGTVLDERYRLVDVIGVGGMGTVFAAEHLKLGRRVAIKMLREEYRGDAGLRARFTAEARTMADIGHDHIVSVLDIGTAHSGSLYFVMEHLEGEDLADTLARETRLPWARVRVIGRQLCEGLEACHARKIIHRDLKPPNCFMVKRVDDRDYVKILDFGIAKMLAAEGRRPTDPHGLHRVDSRRWRHTTTGEVFGTMAYMSPEHFFGEPVDHRTDVYALGVILYEMLTGTTPLAAGNIGNFAEELRYLDPRPPSEVAPAAGIPADVDWLVLRALAKKPEDRFQSMREFARALVEARADAPVRPLAPPAGVDSSGSTTMVWTRPEAQAALAAVLPGPATTPSRWPRRAGWIAAGAVLAAGLWTWWAWPRAREPEAEAVAPPALPTVPREPVMPAPRVTLVAPPAGVQAARTEESPVTPVTPVKPQEPRCPPVTEVEWRKIFAPIAAEVEACKVREGVKATIAVALEVRVGGGQVATRTLPRQSGKVLAAARCIRRHAGRLKLPGKLLGCRMKVHHYF